MYTKNRVFFIIILLQLTLPIFADRPIAPKGVIRVGIFQFEPINFIDKYGNAQGLYPDLLREITKDEDWTVTYVEGSWAQGLERLQSGEIDLMVSVAYTEERDKIMDFNYESVMEIWGQVFIRPEDKSVNINNLQGKKIGIMSKDISGTNFISTASDLNIKCEIIEYPTHGDVFAAVEKGEVFGGVAPQHFGLRNAYLYDIIPSTIQFSPFSIFFASKDGKQDLLLNHIDSHLTRWKVDQNSYYYEKLSYWMTGKNLRRDVIPKWIIGLFSGVIFIAIILVLFVLLLRIKVRRAVENLSESDEKFTKISENAPVLINSFNGDGQCLFWNKQCQKTFGWTKDEIDEHKVPMSLFYPDPEVYEEVLRTVSTDPDGNFREWHPITKDGKLLSIMWANFSLPNGQVYSMGYDITDRQKAENALKKSEDKFRALFELSPVGMAMIDHLTGSFLEVNNAVLKPIGYTKEEFLALNFWDITPKEYDKQEKDQIKDLNTTGRFGPNEKEYIRKDGSRYPIRISGFLMEGNNDVWGIIEDLTEIKKKEEEKEKLLTQLNQRNKMDSIGALAGGMAHDFNNILSGILGASELLKSPSNALSDKNRKYVEMIIQAAVRASELISKLMAFSRKGNKITTSLNIDDILSDTVDILKRTVDKKITFSLILNAPRNIFLGDYSAIESALINLGINASHAMPNGGVIQITTNNIYIDQDFCGSSLFEINAGDFLQIQVKDIGIGIPSESLQKIFEPFYTTKEQGKGSGLGLSAVYGTIIDHHGAIEVFSQIGKGTTFNILLPTSKEQCKTDVRQKTVKNGSGTILFVDDEELNRVLAVEIFESLGYKVILASNGKESVEIFRSMFLEIDIVLMDMIMPIMNGTEAFYNMKEIDKQCKVILTSGYTKDQNIEKLLHNGLAGFINKPYNISEISQLLNDIYQENH